MPSLETLAYLASVRAVDLVGVVTQPDRPGHRGRITVPPVKERALARGIPVLQPERARGDGHTWSTREMWRAVIDLWPDALVWAAYGGIVPKALIEAVKGRAVNVHPSLLPRWRGAEPVAHAILAGDVETGVTLMEGTAELDAGPIIRQMTAPIPPNATTGDLEAQLAVQGAQLLRATLPDYLRGRLEPRPQDGARVTWAPKLDPKEGELDFERPADELVRVVRAFTPDPGAYTHFRGRRINVLRASVAGGSPAEQGTLDVRQAVPHVAAGGGWLRLEEVRPAGKRAMSGADWARGLRDLAGARLPS